jgi:hypothetical protein
MDLRPTRHVNETNVVGREARRPVDYAGLGEFGGFRVWALDGAKKSVAMSGDELMLHGRGDEAAAVAIDAVDTFHQLDGKSHGYSFGRRHDVLRDALGVTVLSDMRSAKPD